MIGVPGDAGYLPVRSDRDREEFCAGGEAVVVFSISVQKHRGARLSVEAYEFDGNPAIERFCNLSQLIRKGQLIVDEKCSNRSFSNTAALHDRFYVPALHAGDLS